MKEIALTQGKFAKVDDCDFEWLSKYNWHLSNNGYAERTASSAFRRVEVYMHREIANTPNNTQTDHIDNNKLNNCRDNLRFCNNTENHRNTPKRNDNTSGFKGVSYDKQTKKWRAKIKYSGKTIHLGRFYTAEEAAKNYDRAAIKYFGSFACTNFKYQPARAAILEFAKSSHRAVELGLTEE